MKEFWQAPKTLYSHKPHWHQPRNPNSIHEKEIERAGFNKLLAISITKATGSMWCAYAFACLAIIGFPALSALLGPQIPILIIWISQTFIQLCMLPILSVGQSVLGRKAEIQADEQFNTTQRSYHDIEQIMHHLDAQDDKILEILARMGGMGDGERNSQGGSGL